MTTTLVPPKPKRSSFGAYLRRRRREVDLTQHGLAECCAISPSMVALIETGRRRPSIDVAQRLARCLRVPRNRLLRELLKP